MEHHRIAVGSVELHVAEDGAGPAVVLLHGWPHTWFLWRHVMAGLAARYRVIAPDLRGLGASDRARTGYDLHTLADDVVAVLDALDEPDAVVVGIDLGVAVAGMTALRHPTRVRGLAATEGLLARLPGAEGFTAPWWFGFHGVPGLAETVLDGHEAEYVDWFLRIGTASGDGIAAEARDAFVAAHGGVGSMRCGFEHYRAFGVGAEQMAAAGRLGVPALAVAGGVVGEVVGRQLEGIGDDVTHVRIEGCGHLVPEERPAELTAALAEFAGRVSGRGGRSHAPARPATPAAPGRRSGHRAASRRTTAGR